jgi:hypothetical protein
MMMMKYAKTRKREMKAIKEGRWKWNYHGN